MTLRRQKRAAGVFDAYLFLLRPLKIFSLGVFNFGMLILGFLTVERLQELIERRSCWSLASAMAKTAAHARTTAAAALLPAEAPHSNKAASPLAASHRNVWAANATLRAARTRGLFLAGLGDGRPCATTTVGCSRGRAGVASGVELLPAILRLTTSAQFLTSLMRARAL